MRKNHNAIGFISAPSWLDPAPDEFRMITQGKISIQQTFLDPPGFDYSCLLYTSPSPRD